MTGSSALTLAAIFGSSFLVGLSGAMMPGPLFTAVVGESARRGAIAGPLAVAGHLLLEMLLVLALLLGLAPWIDKPMVFAVIAMVGAVVLLYMAISMFRSLPKLSLSFEGGAPNNRLVLTGVVLSLSNPYWSVWWATVGLTYILQSRLAGWWGVIFFFAGHTMSDLVWYSAVSVAVHKGRRIMSDKVYKGMIAVCASFLVVLGGLFFFAGIVKI